MSQVLQLKAIPRTQTGKRIGKIRTSGRVPAVLYGHKVPTTLLTVDQKEFIALYSKTGGSTLVTLEVEGSETPKTVLVQDVQHHFLSDDPSHVDFYQVNMTEKIKAHVALQFVGESKAVKDLGGVLIKSVTEIEVEALPADLPHAVEVDISKLSTFEDFISVDQLSIDLDKVKVFRKADDIVAKVAPPRSDEELKSLEEKPVEEVSAVEGVIKETPAAETAAQEPEKS